MKVGGVWCVGGVCGWCVWVVCVLCVCVAGLSKQNWPLGKTVYSGP